MNTPLTSKQITHYDIPTVLRGEHKQPCACVECRAADEIERLRAALAEAAWIIRGKSESAQEWARRREAWESSIETVLSGEPSPVETAGDWLTETSNEEVCPKCSEPMSDHALPHSGPPQCPTYVQFPEPFCRVEEQARDGGCACSECVMWTIVYDDEGEPTEIGQAWRGRDGQEVAQDICNLMNLAYERGQQSASSPVETIAAPATAARPRNTRRRNPDDS